MCAQLRTQRVLSSMPEMHLEYDKRLPTLQCVHKQTSLYLTCLLTAQQNAQACLNNSLQSQPASQRSAAGKEAHRGCYI